MECCGQDEFIGIGIRMAQGRAMADDFFKINGMRFYARAKEQLVAEEICSNRGVVILDLGSDYAKARPYLLRCDKRIILGSTAPWKIEQFLGFIERHCNYEDKLTFSVIGTLDGITVDKKDKLRLKNLKVGNPVIIPFIREPFQVMYEHCKVFETLIHASDNISQMIPQKTGGGYEKAKAKS